MRALIIDNHPLFRQGLAGLLERVAPSADVVVDTRLTAALERVKGDDRFDFVAVTVDRPVCESAKLIQALSDHMGKTPILALSHTADWRVLRESMRAGASGFLPKCSEAEEIATALGKLIGGGRYVPDDIPEMGEDLLAHRHVGTRQETGPFDQLTQRQRQVLKAIAHGLSNQEIAGDLGIALATVKLHVNAILRALRVRNRTEAAAMAIVGGLIEGAAHSEEDAPAPMTLRDGAAAS